MSSRSFHFIFSDSPQERSAYFKEERKKQTGTDWWPVAVPLSSGATPYIYYARPFALCMLACIPSFSAPALHVLRLRPSAYSLVPAKYFCIMRAFRLTFVCFLLFAAHSRFSPEGCGYIFGCIPFCLFSYQILRACPLLSLRS